MGTESLLSADAELAERGIRPGNPQYEPEVARIVAQAAKLGARNTTTSAFWRTAMINHAAVTNHMQKDYDTSLKSFRERFGTEVFGSPGIQDLTILENPQSLPDEPTPYKHFYSWEKEKPTGNKVITSYDAGGNAVSKIVPLKKIEGFRKEYSQLLDRQKDIPILHDHSDVGVPMTGKVLDDQTARQILAEAGNDKVKARQLAIQRGYSLGGSQ